MPWSGTSVPPVLVTLRMSSHGRRVEARVRAWCGQVRSGILTLAAKQRKPSHVFHPRPPRPPLVCCCFRTSAKVIEGSPLAQISQPRRMRCLGKSHRHRWWAQLAASGTVLTLKAGSIDENASVRQGFACPLCSRAPRSGEVALKKGFSPRVLEAMLSKMTLRPWKQTRSASTPTLCLSLTCRGLF